MRTPEQVEHEVCEIIADVLGLDLEEVTPDARFFADLGGESIDLLDLEFQCEKRFDVKTDFKALSDSQEIELTPDGVLSADTLSALRERHPFLEFDRLPEHPTQEDMKDLLTVRVITAFVERSLAQAV